MPDVVLQYAKFIIAAIGVTATACLGLIPEGSTAWTIVTIISAVSTALLVWLIPNMMPTGATAVPPPKPTYTKE